MSHGTRICEVEFFGGPNDGYVELTTAPPAEMVVMVQLPRRRGLLWLAGLFRWFSPTIVRLYSYQLVACGGGWRYEHVRTDVASLSGLAELDGLIPAGARKQQLT